MTFYDNNEQIAFPLLATDDGQIPADLLVDCIVHAPKTLGQVLSLKSISVTSLIVSVILAIDGVAVAYYTALKSDLVTHQALPITPIAIGVSGFIAFGEGVMRHLLRVDGVYPFVSASLIRFDRDTTNATVVAGGHSFYGLVKLVDGSGITVTSESLRVHRSSDVVTVTAAVLSADLPSMMDDPLPACLRSVESSANTVKCVTAINDVVPDCAGNIDLEIVNIREIPTVPGVTLSTELHIIILADDGAPCE